MTTSNIFFGTTNQGRISYNFATNDFSIFNENVEQINIDSNGNIGIGFTNSQYKLDVSGDINTNSSYRISGNEVLNSTTLGTNIVNSSLTGVGTLTTLVVSGNTSIQGDLTVNGTTTTFNTENLTIEDPLMKLAKSNIADTVDTGFYSLYNDGATKFTGLFRDASDGVYKFFDGLVPEPTTVINLGGDGYSTASLLVNNLNATTLTITSDSNLANINLSGNILPQTTNTYDLGTTSSRFKDLYLSGNTIHINGAQLSSDNTTLKVNKDLAVNENDFYVDTVNSRIGIGTTTPSVPLDVIGDINTSTDYNISGTQVLSSTTLGSNVVNSSLTSNTGNLTNTGTLNLTTGNDFQINSVSMLNATTLGSSIVNSSLTSNTGNLTNTGTLNLTTGNDFQINSSSVLNATTLGGSVTNSFLNLNTGDMIQAGIFNLTSGKDYQINSSSVLNATTLGSNVVNSSLTSIGTLTHNVNTTGTNYQINGTSVLNATTLGTAVVNSSLTSVGTLTALTVSGDLTVDTNSLYVDSAGNNIGIGTTNPIGKLHIEDDTDNQADETSIHGLIIASGSSGQSMMMGYDADDDISYINSGKTGSTTNLALQTRGGNVGIGITNPSVQLDVNGSALFTKSTSGGDVSVQISNSSNTSNSDTKLIISSAGSSGGDAFIDFNVSGENGWTVGIDNSDDNNFKFDSGSPATVSGNTVFMIKRSNGFVGIGAYPPTYKLNVIDASNTDLAMFGGNVDSDSFINVGDHLQRMKIGYKPSASVPTDNIGTAQVLVNSTGDLLLSSRTNNASGVKLYTNAGTAAVERVRIDNTNIQFFSGSTNNNDSVLELRTAHTGTNNARYVEFFRSATTITDGTSEGWITTDGSGNLAFLDASDRRLKQNIIEYDNGDDIIKALRTVKYDWKDEDKQNDCLGFIAQEVQEVLPRSVNEIRNGYLGISRVEMIPVMWSALRKALYKIDELETKINELG